MPEATGKRPDSPGLKESRACFKSANGVLLRPSPRGGTKAAQVMEMEGQLLLRSSLAAAEPFTRSISPMSHAREEQSLGVGICGPQTATGPVMRRHCHLAPFRRFLGQDLSGFISTEKRAAEN